MIGFIFDLTSLKVYILYCRLNSKLNLIYVENRMQKHKSKLHVEK